MPRSGRSASASRRGGRRPGPGRAAPGVPGQVRPLRPAKPAFIGLNRLTTATR